MAARRKSVPKGSQVSRDRTAANPRAAVRSKKQIREMLHGPSNPLTNLSQAPVGKCRTNLSDLFLPVYLMRLPNLRIHCHARGHANLLTPNAPALRLRQLADRVLPDRIAHASHARGQTPCPPPPKPSMAWLHGSLEERQGQVFR